MSAIIKPIPTSGVNRRLLRPEDANAVGSITTAPGANNTTTVTIPAGGPMSSASTAPGFLWWDTGLLISSTVDRYIGLRIDSVVVAGSTSGDAVLGAGFIYTNGTPDLATDEYGWLQMTFGLGAAANSTCNTITRRDTNSIVAGTAVSNFNFGDYLIRHQSVGDSRQSFVGWTVGSTSRDYNVTVDATAISRSLGIKAFVLFGRSAAEASPIDVAFRAQLLPPGSA